MKRFPISSYYNLNERSVWLASEAGMWLCNPLIPVISLMAHSFIRSEESPVFYPATMTMNPKIK